MPPTPNSIPASARGLRHLSRVVLLSFIVPIILGLAGTSWVHLVTYPLAFHVAEGSMPLIFVVISLGWLADWFILRVQVPSRPTDGQLFVLFLVPILVLMGALTATTLTIILPEALGSVVCLVIFLGLAAVAYRFLPLVTRFQS